VNSRVEQGCSSVIAEHNKGTELQRLFSTFPGGLPAIGLLLLRAAVGVTAMVQGGVCLSKGDGSFEHWGVGLTMAASGILLLVGFLTPVAGALVALATVSIALSWFPSPAANLFNAPLPAILVVIMAVALALIGPGVASVDRRLFGRREIIISHTPRKPGS